VEDSIVETPENIVVESIQNGAEYLPVLAEGLRSVSRLCQEGREGEGINLFIEAIEGLEWLTSVLQGITTFNLQRTTTSSRDKSFNQLATEYNDKLTELSTAWENSDFVLVSDLLEYELVPLLDEITVAFQTFSVNN